MAELGASSTSRNDVISMDKVKDIIRDIGRYLTDEKLYKPEQAAEVFKLEPSESFVTFLNDLLLKLKRKKSKDKFLKEFYGTTNLRWQEYFHPYPDKRMVFLMLIHLPERLLICIEQDKGPSDPEVIYCFLTTSFIFIIGSGYCGCGVNGILYQIMVWWTI